jgi:hypothetical protein
MIPEQFESLPVADLHPEGAQHVSGFGDDPFDEGCFKESQ